MNVNKLADHILAFASNNENQITNLQLHKTLFFTIGFGIRNKIKPIDEIKKNYNNEFSRWRYGPVVPELYHRYNHYGYQPIKDKGKYYNELEEFDPIIKKLLDVDVYNMVAVSHEMESWKTYEEDILNKNYVPRYEFWEIERDFINAQ
ncbi:hypothetical protein [Oceanobacillus sp. FSL W7-1281]|uniref:Panacea domain-containing protein n=1 Tax=Oceanobacillus sp. FSL W7-1281 TaxID=2921698 RepID=UPI0030DD8A5A